MFSISGSSKRQCEETIVFNFYQFLKQCDKGNVQRKFIDVTTLESPDEEFPETEQLLTLQHVLQFLTGARNIPLGNIDGSIVFAHDALKGARVKANTCALQLTIQVNERYFSEESATFLLNFADDNFDGQGLVATFNTESFHYVSSLYYTCNTCRENQMISRVRLCSVSMC